MAKKRIKVWGKMNLYETSCVGIPAYPDAHASADSFSLIKSLTNASLKGFAEENEEIGGEQLNLQGGNKETMEEESQTVEEPKAEEVVEEEVAEKSAEPEPTEEAVEEPKTEETEKSTDMSEMIAKAIKDGIKDGIKELEVERGVIENKQPAREKSVGEMAIEQGLFVIR